METVKRLVIIALAASMLAGCTAKGPTGPVTQEQRAQEQQEWKARQTEGEKWKP